MEGVTSDQDIEDGEDDRGMGHDNEADEDGRDQTSCGQEMNGDYGTDDEGDVSMTEQVSTASLFLGHEVLIDGYVVNASPEKDASTRSSRLAKLRARREELANKRAQPQRVRPASANPPPASPSPTWSSSSPPAAREVAVNKFIQTEALCSQDTDTLGDLDNYGGIDK